MPARSRRVVTTVRLHGSRVPLEHQAPVQVRRDLDERVTDLQDHDVAHREFVEFAPRLRVGFRVGAATVTLGFATRGAIARLDRGPFGAAGAVGLPALGW